MRFTRSTLIGLALALVLLLGGAVAVTTGMFGTSGSAAANAGACADDDQDEHEDQDENEVEGADDAGEVEGANEAEDANGDGDGEIDDDMECDDAEAASGTIDDGAELLPQARITLEQAIVAAQGAASGSVGEVDLEDYNGTLVFNVEIGSHDVKVDAANGTVLGSESDD